MIRLYFAKLKEDAKCKAIRSSNNFIDTIFDFSGDLHSTYNEEISVSSGSSTIMRYS